MWKSKINGCTYIVYCAVDSERNTIDFYLGKTRDYKAAKRFFKKALRSFHVSKPRVITIDKNPAYPIAIEVADRLNLHRETVSTYVKRFEQGGFRVF
jgi:transposase-like protein